MLEFEIPGKPIAMQRHRSIVTGRGRTVMFNPQGKIKKQKQLEAKILSGVKKPTLSAVNIILDFYFKRPKNHFGTGKNADILKESAEPYHCKKPDIDNLSKFYLDVFNGILYRDDAQIKSLIAHKKYINNKTAEPHTTVWLETAEPF